MNYLDLSVVLDLKIGHTFDVLRVKMLTQALLTGTAISRTRLLHHRLMDRGPPRDHRRVARSDASGPPSRIY